MDFSKLVEDIIDGYAIKKDEAMELWNIDYESLLGASEKIKRKFCNDKFEICTIISAKSGKCSEDCKYCAQSSSYKTSIDSFELLDKDVILKDALVNYSKGIRRYSIVTSGKRARRDEVDKLCEIFSSIKNTCDMKLCSSNGLLTYDEFIKFKLSGVTRIHNNLESSREYFPNICTSHSYDEKIETIRAALSAGLEVCSGGIMGLGESNLDRVSLAFELRDLGIRSIPLNFLNPIEGTPLYDNQMISEEEFLRSAAIFRFINPKAIIRLAGGRNLLSSYGKKAFETSVNGTISGELLTTYGNDTEKDLLMIKELNYEINN